MSYKFIVISACEERKKGMVKKFKKLGVPDELVYYLDASTPQNSEEFFKDSSITDETTKKIICCTRSHFRALEYATRDDSPEYSIIVEDDAVFHKRNFIRVVEEIIKNWDQHLSNYDYVSLGWIPCNPYSHYKKKASIKIESISKIDEELCFLYDFYNVGAQCYMIKRERVMESRIRRLYNHSRWEDLKECIDEELKCVGGREGEISVDFIMNRVLRCVILSPMVVIEEKGCESLLGHENERYYWSVYFEGEEGERRREGYEEE